MKSKRIFYLILAVIVALVIVQISLNQKNKNLMVKIEEKYQERFFAFTIINELRQVSLDLTQFAQLYTRTKVQKYWDNYWIIINWKSGNTPRPQNISKELFPGETKEQHQIIREINFSENELTLFEKVSKISINQIVVEEQVMQSVKMGVLKEGALSIFEGEEMQDFALRILDGMAYHNIIFNLRDSIDRLIAILDNRLYKELEDLKTETLRINRIILVIRSLLLISVLIFVIFLFYKLIIFVWTNIITRPWFLR